MTTEANTRQRAQRRAFLRLAPSLMLLACKPPHYYSYSPAATQSAAPAAPPTPPAATQSAAPAAPPTQPFLFSKYDIWVRPSPDKKSARLGLTHYATRQLGPIIYLHLNTAPEGRIITSGGKLGELESMKSVLDLISPVSGKVTLVNTAVLQSPERLDAEAQGAGWLIEVELHDPTELDGLMNHSAYQASVSQGTKSQ